MFELPPAHPLSHESPVPTEIQLQPVESSIQSIPRRDVSNPCPPSCAKRLTLVKPTFAPHASTIRSIWFVHAHTSCTDCGAMRDLLSSAAHVNLLYVCTPPRWLYLPYQALATSLRAAAGAGARTASHVLNYSTSYTKPSCQGKRSLPMYVSPDH